MAALRALRLEPGQPVSIARKPSLSRRARSHAATPGSTSIEVAQHGVGFLTENGLKGRVREIAILGRCTFGIGAETDGLVVHSVCVQTALGVGRQFAVSLIVIGVTAFIPGGEIGVGLCFCRAQVAARAPAGQIREKSHTSVPYVAIRP